MTDQLFRIMADEAFMGFVTFDLKTRGCVYLNKKSRELFELQSAENEWSLDQVFATSSRGDFKAFTQDLLAHEGLYQDVLLHKLNGQFFIANVAVRRLDSGEQSLVLLMIQDVTLQKKLQREIVAKQLELKTSFEELLKQNTRLKELDLAKDRFVALTTHELRTPLAAMVTSAEILYKKMYDSPEQMDEFVEMIFEQGQHLHALVNDILDFAKIQAGRMDFYIEWQDPSELIQSLCQHFAGMAESHKVAIEVRPAPAPISCYYDELRLRQVLSNIINNAIKYNRKGGSVAISFEDQPECVKIFIRDTGKGIAPDHLQKVFDEFETLGQVAAHHGGTGLGMPISRRLMEGMGGALLLKSELNVGSLFWVEIPKTKCLSEDLYRPRPEAAADDLAA